MAKQIKARRVAVKRVNESKARELWLASLGAASLTRKQGIKLYAKMVNEGRGMQSRVIEAVNGFGAQVNDTLGQINGQINNRIAQVNEKIADVRAKIEGSVQPLRHRAEATYLVLADEVTVRLQPLLVRFGFAAPAKRRAPAKAKKVVRRAAPAKKAVKRATRKAA